VRAVERRREHASFRAEGVFQGASRRRRRAPRQLHVSPARTISLAAGGFLLLLAAAFSWDCVRLLRAAATRVAAAARELGRHEERLLTYLTDSAAVSPTLAERIASYRGARGTSERHTAYDALAGAARTIDPGDRRVADGIAGALNRRDLALRHFADERASCE